MGGVPFQWCFRSVFDRKTEASDGQTRVSMVGGQTMIRSIVIKCIFHDKLIISVMLCYYQAMLVNVYLLPLNTSIQQFIRPNTIAMVILTSWSHTSRVCRDVSTQGDKHTIRDDRLTTCHCQMRMLHSTKTGVTQIARSDPMEMRSRFPVLPVHDNQYGRAELLTIFQDPITSNTAADNCMLVMGSPWRS